MIFSKDDVGYLGDLIYEILECLDELMMKKKTELNTGQSMAYLHILRLVQANLDESIRKDFGLDIDLDRNYIR